MGIATEFTCENGCRVQISDDCLRDLTSDEMARRRAELWTTICAIARNAARESVKDDDFSG